MNSELIVLKWVMRQAKQEVLTLKHSNFDLFLTIDFHWHSMKHFRNSNYILLNLRLFLTLILNISIIWFSSSLNKLNVSSTVFLKQILLVLLLGLHKNKCWCLCHFYHNELFTMHWLTLLKVNNFDWLLWIWLSTLWNIVTAWNDQL